VNDPVAAAELAAEALGYKLVPLKVHDRQTGTTAEKWTYERIRQRQVPQHWLRFRPPGTSAPDLHHIPDSKPAALRALLAELDAHSRAS
jgi:hypothetical protein